MYKFYHSCGFVNADGTRKLIKFWNGEKCICATDNPFLKRPQDCEFIGVQKRAMVNRDRLERATKWTINRYLHQLDNNNNNNN